MLRETRAAASFTPRRPGRVKAVADYLKRVGFDVAPHPIMGNWGNWGNWGRAKSKVTWERFLSGALKAIIAVSDPGAAPLDMGAGMDMGTEIERPDIRFVIHYQYADVAQRLLSGIRSRGRDGWPARCVLLFSDRRPARRSRSL